VYSSRVRAVTCKAECGDSGELLTEEAFSWQLANDGAANDKLGAGLRAFAKFLRRHNSLQAYDKLTGSLSYP